MTNQIGKTQRGFVIRVLSLIRHSGFVILILTGIGGCLAPPAPPPPPTSEPASAPEVTITVPPGVMPRGAIAENAAIFHVEMHVLSVPQGTFASNEDFWKRIDEQCVDVPTAELLHVNGIRVGLAPLAELDHFASFMEGTVPAKRLAITGMEVERAEIEMKLNLLSQVIFHYDRRHTLIGRGYDRCENILNLSFEPAPRKPGYLRLELCPMVRATRKKLQYTQLNEEIEVQFVRPEAIYDLNFVVDIPPEHFLVITPSPQAVNQVSVGHAFFVKGAATDLEEQVFIVVPKRLPVITTP